MGGGSGWFIAVRRVMIGQRWHLRRDRHSARRLEPRPDFSLIHRRAAARRARIFHVRNAIRSEIRDASKTEQKTVCSFPEIRPADFPLARAAEKSVDLQRSAAFDSDEPRE